MGGDAFGSARSCAYHPARRDTPISVDFCMRLAVDDMGLPFQSCSCSATLIAPSEGDVDVGRSTSNAGTDHRRMRRRSLDYLGYRLFAVASLTSVSGGTFKSKIFSMTLTKVGPGVFFALFVPMYWRRIYPPKSATARLRPTLLIRLPTNG